MVRVRWGAIGTPGQRIDRDFGSTAEAVAYAEKHVATHLQNGFVEVVAKPEPADVADGQQHARYEWGQAPRCYQEIVRVGLVVHYRTGRVLPTTETIDKSDTTRCKTPEDAAARYEEHCAEARYHSGELVELQARSGAQRATAAAARRVGDAPAIIISPPPTVLAHEPLEAQCRASPDAPGPWEVYADWLEGQGDPRAELAAQFRAGRHGRVKALIAKLLRGIADDDDMEPEESGAADGEVTIDCELAFGFVREASLALDYEAAVELDVVTRRFLYNPIARFVDRLRFGLAGCESNNDWAPTLRAIVECGFAPRIRSLAFDWFSSEDSELSWVESGDFTGLLDQFTRLEHLHVRAAGGTLGTLPPTLRTFIRESCALAGAELEAIANARWPNLEHVEIWTGSGSRGAQAMTDSFDRFLDARDVPKLRHLGIVNSELVESLIPRIATSKLVGQLDSIDLSRGTGGADAARSLAGFAPQLRHLASIDLSSNCFSEDDVERVRAVLDNVILLDQRDDGDARYVEVGE